jgi:hypothetical protein
MALLQILVQILATVAGIGAVIAVLLNLYQKFSRKL